MGYTLICNHCNLGVVQSSWAWRYRRQIRRSRLKIIGSYPFSQLENARKHPRNNSHAIHQLCITWFADSVTAFVCLSVKYYSLCSSVPLALLVVKIDLLWPTLTGSLLRILVCVGVNQWAPVILPQTPTLWIRWSKIIFWYTCTIHMLRYYYVISTWIRNICICMVSNKSWLAMAPFSNFLSYFNLKINFVVVFKF